jgi:hypothetical protein
MPGSMYALPPLCPPADTRSLLPMSRALASSAVADVREQRFIVLFSDLREDLPPGRSAPELHLTGARVLLTWRPGSDDVTDPNVVARRAQDWHERLLKAGAHQVCARPAEQHDLALAWFAASIAGVMAISLVPDHLGSIRMLSPLAAMAAFVMFGLTRSRFSTPRLADSSCGRYGH